MGLFHRIEKITAYQNYLQYRPLRSFAIRRFALFVHLFVDADIIHDVKGQQTVVKLNI